MHDLGRNEELVISCEFEGHENDCPKDCSTCAIAIKTDGDAALIEKKLPSAIRFYKRALFLEPRFAEARNNLANAYNMINEPNNALDAFEKAIAIDEEYGKALFGKAMTLRKLGRLDDAMQLANDILDLYLADEVIAFKKELVAEGVEDTHYIVENQAFTSELDACFWEIGEKNNLLVDDDFFETIEECEDAHQPEEFVKKVMKYCRQKYASLGQEKVCGEYIITSFYGAICATLFYLKDNAVYENVQQFEYLKDHIDIEFTDRNAERMLQTKAGEEKAEHIWEIILPYVKLSQDIFNKTTKLTDELIIHAMQGAYDIGMIVAVYYSKGRDKKHGLGTRAEIDEALLKLAASQSGYQEPPERSAMCYSMRIPDDANITCTCENCGKTFEMRVFEGNEDIVRKYRELAKEFVALGHSAKVSVYCDDCAKKLHPSSSSWDINRIVFTFVASGSTKEVHSYPNDMSYSSTEYDTALSFLRGSETLTEISTDTATHFSSKAYLEHIKNVLGTTPKR